MLAVGGARRDGEQADPVTLRYSISASLRAIASWTGTKWVSGSRTYARKNSPASSPPIASLPYLLYWYLGAFVFAIAAILRSRLRPAPRREIWLGAWMGACSLLGQTFTALALSHGVPGHVAFPITTGGLLFLVGAAGRLLFREKVGGYGIAGMILGIAALVALSVG